MKDSRIIAIHAGINPEERKERWKIVRALDKKLKKKEPGLTRTKWFFRKAKEELGL